MAKKQEVELLLDHLEEVDKVAEEYMKGQNPTQIAETLGMKRVRVTELIREWQGMISDNAAIRSRAKEALAAADRHYSKLTGTLYEVIEAADASPSGSLSQKTNAVKAIVDIEAKRIDMLHKSGALENKELAEQLIRTEQRQELLEGILKEVISSCNVCKPEVMKRLADADKDGPPVVVEYHG